MGKRKINQLSFCFAILFHYKINLKGFRITQIQKSIIPSEVPNYMPAFDHFQILSLQLVNEQAVLKLTSDREIDLKEEIASSSVSKCYLNNICIVST